LQTPQLSSSASTSLLSTRSGSTELWPTSTRSQLALSPSTASVNGGAGGSGSGSARSAATTQTRMNRTAIAGGFPDFSDPSTALAIEQMRMDKILRRQNKELEAMLEVCTLLRSSVC
jgi:hypothetical protein